MPACLHNSSKVNSVHMHMCVPSYCHTASFSSRHDALKAFKALVLHSASSQGCRQPSQCACHRLPCPPTPSRTDSRPAAVGQTWSSGSGADGADDVAVGHLLPQRWQLWREADGLHVLGLLHVQVLLQHRADLVDGRLPTLQAHTAPASGFAGLFDLGFMGPQTLNRSVTRHSAGDSGRVHTKVRLTFSRRQQDGAHDGASNFQRVAAGGCS